MPASSQVRSGLAPEKLLPADDARAYRRFLDWSVGYGFKLAVVEITAPWKRDALMEWTASAVSGTRALRLDEASHVPLSDLFEQAFAPPGETAVLLLTHLEEASNRRRVCAQLNVQRDDLAHAFAVPWVVLIHPHAALEMQRDAPDFSDFAGLWLRDEEEPGGSMASLESRAPTLGPSVSGGVGVVLTGLLREANDALDAGQYDRARDRIAQQGIAHPEEERSPAWLLVRGRLSHSTGQLGEARVRFEEALRACEILGDEQMAARALSHLGSVLRAQGDLAGARERMERSLRIQAKVFGTEEHPEVAASLHALGDVLGAQGDLGGAREHLERSLRIQAKVLGTEEHPSVAASLHELAAVLQAQGDLAGACARLERALSIWAKVLGTEEHPSVAASLHALAGVLRAQGDLAGARALYERVLAIDERLYGGREHYSTAITEMALGSLLAEMGDTRAAEHLFQHAYQVFLRTLGPEHPYTKQLAQRVQPEPREAV